MKMKKTKLIYLAMVTAFAGIVQLSSCSEDDKPQTIPTVKTLTAVSTGTATAQVSGEISDDGNSAITEAGFVYSSIISEPTIVDTKKTVTDFDELEAELTGLTSGTIYNVRAFATNKKGTAYGVKMTFETGNLAPVVSNVVITGTQEVAKTLTADYTYTDAEGDVEQGTTFQWYVANDANGNGEALITGATAKTFTVQDAQNGKFLSVGVTPKANDGTLTGVEVKSAYTTAVGSETVSFNYNNLPVTYGTIISTVTGKKWLDRNLGAERLAQAPNDYMAYGGSYQWGRREDGHQLVIRTGVDDFDASGVNGSTTADPPFATSDSNTPATNLFIINGVSPADWRMPQENSLWQGVSGINNPCPAGWRLPTRAEWDAEGFTSGQDAYNKLKLTYSGYRTYWDGTFFFADTGYYWTSTVDDSRAPKMFSFAGFFSAGAGSGGSDYAPRANGMSCRCIKE